MGQSFPSSAWGSDLALEQLPPRLAGALKMAPLDGFQPHLVLLPDNQKQILRPTGHPVT